MTTCDPSVPPLGPSRLLALPRELRDIIYDFALTKDEGMMLVERHDPNTSARSFKGCTNNDPTWESNQLKYVSKLLYAETKGLGLGLNELSIQSEQQIADFGVFIATCSTGQQKRIRRVTLSSDDTFPAKALRALSRSVIPLYCTFYPRWDVRLHLSYYNKELNGVMWVWGAVLLLCAINKQTHPFVPEGVRQSMRSATVTRLEVETFDFPNNVRIFPGALPDMSLDLAEATSELWGDRDDHIKYVREELRKWYCHGY